MTLKVSNKLSINSVIKSNKLFCCNTKKSFFLQPQIWTFKSDVQVIDLCLCITTGYFMPAYVLHTLQLHYAKKIEKKNSNCNPRLHLVLHANKKNQWTKKIDASMSSMQHTNYYFLLFCFFLLTFFNSFFWNP